MSGRVTDKRPKMTNEQFAEKAKTVHGCLYDYSKSIYLGYQIKLEIICKRCNLSFWMQPNNHLNGQKCSHCFGKKRFTTVEFIKKSSLIHGNIFNYSKVNYINNNTKVEIKCNVCDKFFKQQAASHLRGAGCNYCARIKSALNRTKSKEDFIKQSINLHGNKYDYSLVEYKNSFSKIKLICNDCNLEFKQLPANHLVGKGCLQCCLKQSKPEKKWLDSLNIDEKYRQKTIWCGKIRYVVDALIPETNTIYEFYGDFWHGNPKTKDANKINKKAGATFGELYLKTVQKENALKELGYKIISIWESDFKNV